MLHFFGMLMCVSKLDLNIYNGVMLQSDQKMTIYMDYAATTPVDPRILKAMEPYFSEEYGNTMSLHRQGRKAKQALEESRKTVAELMNAEPNELIFMGSATESNNTVIKGIAYANKTKGKHIIVSSIEHDCVLEPARWLKKQGYEISRLPVEQIRAS